MSDLSHSGEVVRYLVGFWAFLLSPDYRAGRMQAWRLSRGSARALLALDAAVTTFIGVGLPAFLGLVVLTATRR
jgi:hypothetical protein